MIDVMTKYDLLNRMDQERKTWDNLLAAVGEAGMTEPGVGGHWSVKDIVAHVGYWQRWLLANITEAATGREATALDRYGVETLPQGAETWTEDEFNNWTYLQFLRRPAPIVLMEEQQTYHRLYTVLRGMRDEDLLTPGRFKWTHGSAVWEYVASSCYDHMAHHSQAIRAWLEQGTAA